METNADLKQQHPDLESRIDLYVEWDELFSGGAAIETQSGASKYLIRHPFETQTQYDIRLARATYRNHAAAIVNVFTAPMWDVDRSEVDQDISENVDRLGTSASQFFQSVLLNAAARGLQYVVVDSPMETGKTRAETKQTHSQPYMVSIDPWNVLDWQYGETYSLEWVKIKQAQVVPRRPGAKFTVKEQYKIWFPDRWELWEPGDKGPVLILEGLNPIGVVPIVPFYFVRKGQFVGDSALSIVSGLLKRIFRRDSELDKSLFDSAVEIAVFLGFSEDDLSAFTVSGTNGIRSDSVEADMKYVAPTGRAYEALRQAINEDEARAREIALRMLKPDSKQVESADSKKEDRKQLDSQLVRFANLSEAAENKCWELWGKWGGADPAVVSYPFNFDEQTLSSILIDSFVKLRQTEDLSRETLWTLLQERGLLPENFDVEEERQRLEADLKIPSVQGLFTSRENEK